MLSNHLILCHPILLLPSIFASIKVFSSELTLHTRCPKYWSISFSISPFIESSGLISFRIDWFDFMQPKDSQESSLAPQFEVINSLVFNLLYSPTLTPIHDYWKNQFSQSVQLLSRVQLFVTPWTAARQASLSSPTPRAYSNSGPLSRWYHPTISS